MGADHQGVGRAGRVTASSGGSPRHMPSRIRLTAAALGALFVLSAPPAALAQCYPDRPIRLIAEFPPGGANIAVNGFQESGAVVYVLEGRLRLDAGGMRDTLETGDCACMESEMPMAWSAADKHRCRVLAVMPRGNAPAKPPA